MILKRGGILPPVQIKFYKSKYSLQASKIFAFVFSSLINPTLFVIFRFSYLSVVQNGTRTASSLPKSGRRSFLFCTCVFHCFGKTSMGLKSIRHFEQQFFRLFPAEARVGDGFAVNSLLRLAGAVLNVALYHKTLYELFNVRGHFAAVEDFF